MLFTMIVALFRHSTQHTAKDTANSMILNNVREEIKTKLYSIFNKHPFAVEDLELLKEKIDILITQWKQALESNPKKKYYYWDKHPDESVGTLLSNKKNETDVLVVMQSMRNVEPSSEITIRKY
jgi:hypothetical protein